MPVGGGGSSGGGLGSVVLSGTAASGKQIVASSAVAAAWAYPPGYEWSYTQITATVNVTGTSEAAGTTIISPGAFTPDGSLVLCTFFSPQCKPAANAAGDFLRVTLFEGATEIGVIAFVQTPSITSACSVSLTGTLRFTPTAASHTYTVTASVPNTTGTPFIAAGAGGTGAFVPAFVRFTKV